jgi:hypothetical protein
MVKLFAYAAFLCLVAFPLVAGATTPKEQQPPKTYDQDEVLKEAEKFFGSGAKGLAEVIAKAFKEEGEPMAVIKGEEAGAAVGVGYMHFSREKRYNPF